jgi:hypothetical protein
MIKLKNLITEGFDIDGYNGNEFHSPFRIPEKNNFSIEVVEILEFIDFLRKCGGFKIW